MPLEDHREWMEKANGTDSKTYEAARVIWMGF